MEPSRLELPRIWLPGIAHCIAQFLDTNEISCTLRLLNKETAQWFANQAVVRLSKPVPHHAFRYKWDNDQIMKPYKYSKRIDFVTLTAASGCLANLELAVQRAGIELTCFIYWLKDCHPLSAAAAAGHIHICKWLKDCGCPMDSVQLEAASLAGRQEMCAWMLNNGWRWHEKVVYAAARGGHTTLIPWLLEQKPDHKTHPDHSSLVTAVAEGCNLAILQRFCHEWQAQGNVAQAPTMQMATEETEETDAYLFTLAAAARSPTPDWQAKLEWLEAQPGFIPQGTLVCLTTAQLPDALERLTWLRGRGYPVDMEVVIEAAQVGNLDVMTMLLDHGVEDECSAWFAVKRGQLQALKLLHNRGRRLGKPEGIVQAALNGHNLEVVDWLVKEVGLGAALDEMLQRQGGYWVNEAAAQGSVVKLEWLHERGCRGNQHVFYRAVLGGCQEVIEWLLAHGYNFPSDTRPYVPACKNGDFAMLACLRRLGCPWNETLQVDKQRCFPRKVWHWIKTMKLPYHLKESSHDEGEEVEKDSGAGSKVEEEKSSGAEGEGKVDIRGAEGEGAE